MNHEDVRIQTADRGERIRVRIRLRLDGGEARTHQRRPIRRLVDQSGEHAAIPAPVPGPVVQPPQDLARRVDRPMPRRPTPQKARPRLEASPRAPNDAHQIHSCAD